MPFKLLTRNISLDTSFIESQNFLAGARMLDLAKLYKDNLIRLYITDIVYRETIARFQKNLTTAAENVQKSTDSFQSTIKLLRNFREYSTFFNYPKIDSVLLLDSFKKMFDAWIMENEVITISTHEIRCEEIFNDYFNNLPPFETTKKKYEFPDAFSIKGLIKFFSGRNEKTYLLTNDGGIKSIRNDWLIPTDNPVDLIDTIIRSVDEIKTNESIRLIEVNFQKQSEPIAAELTNALYKLIQNEISQLIEIEKQKNIQLKQLVISEPTLGKISISQLGLNEHVAQVECMAEFKVDIVLLADDFANAWYDKTTNTYRFVTQKEIRLSDTFIIPVSFNVNYDLAVNVTQFSIISVNQGYSIDIYRSYRSSQY